MRSTSNTSHRKHRNGLASCLEFFKKTFNRSKSKSSQVFSIFQKLESESELPTPTSNVSWKC